VTGPVAGPPAVLRTFFMEDHLESSRFVARYNLGESGSWPSTFGELALGTGLDEASAARAVLGMSLRDSPNWGNAELRDRIAGLHAGSTAGEVLVTTGSSEALSLLLHRLRPARTALAMPAFQLLYEVPRSLGSEIVELPVRWDAAGQPFIDETEWLDLVRSARPDCVILNQPHNPSGLMFAPAFLDRLIELALDVGATVVGDEHYRFLASETAALGPTVYRRSRRVFVTGSYIKCLGCPGLRIGWCVGDPEVLTAVQSDKNYTTHTVNPISEWISGRVLADLGAPIWQHHRGSWLANRRALAAFLASSDAFLGVAPAGGLVTSIAWRAPRDRAELAAAFAALRAAGVFVLPMDAMEFTAVGRRSPGRFGDGFGFRLGLGARAEAFAEALTVLAQVAGGVRCAR
jgi:aspartate/methionine/tyrosine aminotransferase